MNSNLLSQIPAFERLDANTLEALAQISLLRIFDKGDILYKQDAEAAGFFALLAGQIKLYRQSEKKTQILGLISAGECFGAESLADNARAPWTAEAMGLVETIHFDSDDLKHLFMHYSDLRLVILDTVSTRLQQSVNLVHDLAFKDVASRLATVLLQQADLHAEDGLYFSRSLSQQEIAALVSTAREVVYRTLKRFEADGLLELTPSHFRILDRARLAAIANEEVR